MSGRAYAFAALSVLALTFGAFASAGMLGAAEENYPLTGEVLVGERADAARVEVYREKFQLYKKLREFQVGSLLK